MAKLQPRGSIAAFLQQMRREQMTGAVLGKDPNSEGQYMHATWTLAGIMVPMIQLLLWPARIQAERPRVPGVLLHRPKRMGPHATSIPTVEVVRAHFAETKVSGPVEYRFHLRAWHASSIRR